MKQSDWISFKTALPDNGRDVIIFLPEHPIKFQVANWGGNSFISEYGIFPYEDAKPPTHWMPIVPPYKPIPKPEGIDDPFVTEDRVGADKVKIMRHADGSVTFDPPTPAHGCWGIDDEMTIIFHLKGSDEEMKPLHRWVKGIGWVEVER